MVKWWIFEKACDLWNHFRRPKAPNRQKNVTRTPSYSRLVFLWRFFAGLGLWAVKNGSVSQSYIKMVIYVRFWAPVKTTPSTPAPPPCASEERRFSCRNSFTASLNSSDLRQGNPKVFCARGDDSAPPCTSCCLLLYRNKNVVYYYAWALCSWIKDPNGNLTIKLSS